MFVFRNLGDRRVIIRRTFVGRLVGGLECGIAELGGVLRPV